MSMGRVLARVSMVVFALLLITLIGAAKELEFIGLTLPVWVVAFGPLLARMGGHGRHRDAAAEGLGASGFYLDFCHMKSHTRTAASAIPRTTDAMTGHNSR